jgi:hypothetical protein
MYFEKANCLLGCLQTLNIWGTVVTKFQFSLKVSTAWISNPQPAANWLVRSSFRGGINVDPSTRGLISPLNDLDIKYRDVGTTHVRTITCKKRHVTE